MDIFYEAEVDWYNDEEAIFLKGKIYECVHEWVNDFTGHIEKITLICEGGYDYRVTKEDIKHFYRLPN